MAPGAGGPEGRREGAGKKKQKKKRKERKQEVGPRRLKRPAACQRARILLFSGASISLGQRRSSGGRNLGVMLIHGVLNKGRRTRRVKSVCGFVFKRWCRLAIYKERLRGF